MIFLTSVWISGCKKLSTVYFSDTLTIKNLRSAFSFEKGDYPVLAYGPEHWVYFVVSDPVALVLSEADTSHLTTLDQLNTHPAFLSLSADVASHAQSINFVKFVYIFSWSWFSGKNRFFVDTSTHSCYFISICILLSPIMHFAVATYTLYYDCIHLI